MIHEKLVQQRANYERSHISQRDNLSNDERPHKETSYPTMIHSMLRQDVMSIKIRVSPFTTY